MRVRSTRIGRLVSGDEAFKFEPKVGSVEPSGCGKHASKWMKVVLCMNKPVENVTTFGQKFLISPIDPTSA
jgi:hypothetical protein